MILLMEWTRCWLVTIFWLQKFFRGRRSVAIERSKVRREFCETYGNNCQNVDRYFSFCLILLLHFFSLSSDCSLVTYLSFWPFCYLISAFRNCFEPGSSFLRQLLFFFKAQNSGDFVILVETCRLLKIFTHSNGISNIYACSFCWYFWPIHSWVWLVWFNSYVWGRMFWVFVCFISYWWLVYSCLICLSSEQAI